MDAPLTTILIHTLDQFVGQTLTPDVAARLGASILRQVYPGPVDVSGIEPVRVGRYVLAPVRFHDVIEDLKVLHRRHWDETETHRNQVKELNPDYERFLEVERQGRLLVIGAIDMDTGQLVGNVTLYLAKSMHTQERIATEDTLFLLPEHRRGRLGVSLIEYAETAMRHLGVTELTVDVKLVNDVGPMLERLGYQPVGTRYVKNLKEEANVLA